jgi:hypothetical protein
MPGEPAHLAEIGVIERLLRRQRDGAAQAGDGLAEPARLVRDQPEQMGGIGQVGIEIEDRFAQGRGLFEAAGAAVLLRQDERLGERQRPPPVGACRIVPGLQKFQIRFPLTEWSCRLRASWPEYETPTLS